MKTLTTLVIFLCAFGVHADVLVYKGSLSAFNVSNGAEGRRAQRVYTVLEPETGEAAIIAYYKSSGLLYYSVAEYSGVLLNQFPAARGKIMTVVQLARTDFDDFENPLVTTFFFRGTNSTVEIATQTAARYPTTVKGIARLTGADAIGTPYFSEQSFTLRYDRDSTFVSNNLHYSFEQTVNALRNILGAKGYQDVQRQ